MNRDDTALVVVDVQEKLLTAQPDAKRIVWNCRRLLDAASALGVPADATVQAPEKLGPLAADLAERLASARPKSAFSAAGIEPMLLAWRGAGIRHVLLAGVETHVCVAQTAIDLHAVGFEVKLAIDAVGSRFRCDHDTALRRLESSGVLLTTTEAAMFEWCVTAEDPAFRIISGLAKETAPG